MGDSVIQGAGENRKGTSRGVALIEAIVSLFVVAMVGMALLQMVLMTRKLQARRQQGLYIQSLLNSGLALTLQSPAENAQGQGRNGYHWVGTRTQKAGYRLAKVVVQKGDRVVASGEQVEVE